MAVSTDYSIQSAFNSYGVDGQNIGEDKSILDKDDFLTLLLVELQNQDPTDPQDTDKILQQTSELATLEASQNTNEALSNLSASISSSSQFSSISSIGKMADTGQSTITLENGQPVNFDIYFPEATQGGEIRIKNNQGIVVETLEMDATAKGTTTFQWDGIDNNGDAFEDGDYTIEAVYTTTDGSSKMAQYGVYPIEAVRFEDGQALFKLGSQYVSADSIKEIYDPNL